MRLIYLLLRMILLGPSYGAIVTAAILGTRRRFRASGPEIVSNLHYGANYIHPKHLAIWYFVRTNSDLEEAKTSGIERGLQAETQRLLSRFGYPKSVLSEIHIGMESRENVDKAGGDWRYFH